MTDPMIRGHVIAHTVRFARAHLDWSSAQRLTAELSVELNGALDGITPAAWYPRRYQVELLQALSSARGRSDVAYGDLMLCGSAMATVDNVFMHLLMRVMTPSLFVRKLPMFWKRDHQGSGALELTACDDAAKKAQIKLHGVSGYDHAAVMWQGWIKHILDTLCAGRAQIDQNGWSWGTPGPDVITYDVRWS